VGGPRYEPSQSEDERSSIDNGIWLCSNCSAQVDADPAAFSAHLLREWKLGAELDAHRALGARQSPSADVVAPVALLKALPVGTVVRLAYVLQGATDYVHDKFQIRVEGVDTATNAFRFTSISGGSARGKVDSMPLRDVEEVWLQDGTWRIRTSGYLEHHPLQGHWYQSRPRGR